jgi:hypothetical protein
VATFRYRITAPDGQTQTYLNRRALSEGVATFAQPGGAIT